SFPTPPFPPSARWSISASAGTSLRYLARCPSSAGDKLSLRNRTSRPLRQAKNSAAASSSKRKNGILSYGPFMAPDLSASASVSLDIRSNTPRPDLAFPSPDTRQHSSSRQARRARPAHRSAGLIHHRQHRPRSRGEHIRQSS